MPRFARSSSMCLLLAGALLVALPVRTRAAFPGRNGLIAFNDEHCGESFSLLIVNLLAAVVLLFLMTGLGIAGAIFDDGRAGAGGLEAVWEILLLATIAEVALGLFFFAIVTYRAAVYE